MHKSHVIESLHGVEWICVRCHMCSCHSKHKLLVECGNVDGRIKVKEKKDGKT